jgi:hypothetical protein
MFPLLFLWLELLPRRGQIIDGAISTFPSVFDRHGSLDARLVGDPHNTYT